MSTRGAYATDDTSGPKKWYINTFRDTAQFLIFLSNLNTRRVMLLTLSREV